MCREYGDFIQPDLFVADYLYLVGGLEHEFYDFPYIRNVIIPTDDFWKRLETTNRYIRFSLIPQIPLAVWTSGTSRLSFSLDESRVRLLFSQGTSLFDHVSKAIQSPNLLWLNGCFANITIFVVLDVFLCSCVCVLFSSYFSTYVAFWFVSWFALFCAKKHLQTFQNWPSGSSHLRRGLDLRWASLKFGATASLACNLPACLHHSLVTLNVCCNQLLRQFQPPAKWRIEIPFGGHRWNMWIMASWLAGSHGVFNAWATIGRARMVTSTVASLETQQSVWA